MEQGKPRREKKTTHTVPSTIRVITVHYLLRRQGYVYRSNRIQPVACLPAWLAQFVNLFLGQFLSTDTIFRAK